MTFTIHSSKDGNVQQTLRIASRAAVERALTLRNAGWDVYITDTVGQQYQPEAFDALVARSSAPQGAAPIPQSAFETHIE